ncbi:MAG: FAD/NAD(P)-binding oxidoreductase [Armatimonadota bacterium]|nr:FAD/NAD(P)-binding oxidoreductase [Armatimonadota bacterium]MDR7445297.1 FAD/NAD(P)-binding oxidoreductase [Armatimonadota bacterium]MDR7570647.1 FAD/NAD(P)-binding oxidoreductase [Armatimonadota bacterium]MDR7615287.1 FAD/NAD(P)-binding oxidoreductase [Armatimonadota bacterium]
MADIVVLGAGFGGLSAVQELAPAARAGHRVVLVDRKDRFLMGLRKLWVLAGRGGYGEGSRPLQNVRRHGATWVQGDLLGLELDRRQVRTTAGEFSYDFLVVALGAELRPDLVPGFEHAINLYDAAEVERRAPELVRFAGGRLVVGIFGAPYKCPPAPYEAAMLLEDRFRQRGVRDRVELATFTPQPASLPVVGQAGCARLEGWLAERGIQFLPNRKAQRIEPGRVVFEGDALPFDLLLAVPPHRPPRVVAESGLAPEGAWIRPDPKTLRTTFENVYAVGDVTEILLPNGMPLPKAGVFAEAQGRVAARWILHALGLGPEPEPFDGFGYCFIEVGGGRAAKVVGRFLEHPAPAVEINPPDERTLAEKEAFERERLEAWL